MSILGGFHQNYFRETIFFSCAHFSAVYFHAKCCLWLILVVFGVYCFSCLCGSYEYLGKGCFRLLWHIADSPRGRCYLFTRACFGFPYTCGRECSGWNDDDVVGDVRYFRITSGFFNSAVSAGSCNILRLAPDFVFDAVNEVFDSELLGRQSGLSPSVFYGNNIVVPHATLIASDYGVPSSKSCSGSCWCGWTM